MKNMWKKVLFSIWAIGLVGAGSFGLVNAQSMFGGWDDAWTQNWDDNFWDGNIQQTTKYNPWNGSQTFAKDNLLTAVKKFVNWLLWSLSLIALILCLWWWFQMLTASWDEWKYKKWFTILKQAWIWLAVIALSWMIVSIIFRVIGKSATVTTTWSGS